MRIELLIVTLIGVSIIGLLVVWLQMTRGEGDRARCLDNLKKIGLASHNFESMHKRLPPLFGGSDGAAVVNSLKFPAVWGSTHVFLLPFMEQDVIYESMASGAPAVYDPTTTGGPANSKAIATFVCPADPSMRDGIVVGGIYGGTSYAANAQVFAPLTDETLAGGAMHASSYGNFTDRGYPIARIQDGSSNVIFFTHSYAVCGSPDTGTIWGYGAGVNQSPSPTDTFQPWSRASYLKQTYMTPANGTAFQVQPNPYLTQCKITDPATPHTTMTVVLGDASVHNVTPKITPNAWNKACMPNDELPIIDVW